MSSENTPILAAIVPDFGLFVSSREAIMDDPDLEEENVASLISPGLSVAKRYYNKFGDTDAYIIAMCERTVVYLLASFLNTNSPKSYQPLDSVGMDQEKLVFRGSRKCKTSHMKKGTAHCNVLPPFLLTY
jgi:hypothetical protein